MDLQLGASQGQKTAFASTDVTLYLHFPKTSRESGDVNPTEPVYLLDTASGISVNSFMDKAQVRPLGYTKPAGITRGTQTVAGSFSIIMNGHNPMQELKLLEADGNTIGTLNVRASSLPPFNLLGVAVNEHGAAMTFKILGVSITTLGFSSQLMDNLIEENYEFIADDWQPLSREDSGAIRKRLHALQRANPEFRDEVLRLDYAHNHVARTE